jgi:hypothetical protein
VYHFEFLREAKEALGVSHKQIATWIQAMPELIDEALLFRFIKINHHVAAQNNVVPAWKKLGFQVVKVELHQVFQLLFDGVLVSHFFEIAQAARVIHRLHLRLGIFAFLTGPQTCVADI